MGARVRVVQVIARLNVGGPALLVGDLVGGLDPERYEVRLLAGHVGPDEVDYVALRDPTLPVTYVPGLGREPSAAGDLRALRSLVAELRAWRPDIVHTHTAKAGVLGRLAAQSLRPTPRLVHTFHGHLLHGYFSPVVTRAVALTERALARRTDALLAVGAQVRDDLLAARIGRPGQYRVVEPGLDLGPVPDRSAARDELQLPPGAEVVSFVGRLAGIKRPERFVELALRVGARRPDAVFVLAGDGPALAELRVLAAPLGDRVRFLGWRGDPQAVYAASDVVVLTSDNEGMPLSLIEAAWCGVPVVATAVGSVAEVVVEGETGLLTPPDAGALAAAVVRLLDDPVLRARLGTAAAGRAHERFSRSAAVAAVADVYSALTPAGS